MMKSTMNLTYLVAALFAFAMFENLEKDCLAKNFFVAKNGKDNQNGSKARPLRTIQRAIDLANSPGDKILVRAGVYREKLQFNKSGSPAGYIALQNFQNERVFLDGTNVSGQNMIYMENLNYIRVKGLYIRNNTGVTDGSGIRVEGRGHHLEFINNTIYNMLGRNAMGITVYGTQPAPVRDLKIIGNHIFDCEPAPSEALTVNGNVLRFRIAENVVHDVNNIGIDAIGGEQDINPDQALVARNGSIVDNLVYRANSNYGGGYGAGIYVDGGKNILIERNEVFECDMGIEIGAENKGLVTTRVTVRNNLVHHNDKVGIVFGGYNANVGRVSLCRFVNNTVYKNDTFDEGLGQLWIQWASNNFVMNNIFVAGDNKVLTYSENGNVNNRLNYNLWFCESGQNNIDITWAGQSAFTFAKFKQVSGQGQKSIFGNPRFANPNVDNYRLRPNSPAIDNGWTRTGLFAPADFIGVSRPQGISVDMGAFEKN